MRLSVCVDNHSIHDRPEDPDSPLRHPTDRELSLESLVALQAAGLVVVWRVSTVDPKYSDV